MEIYSTPKVFSAYNRYNKLNNEALHYRSLGEKVIKNNMIALLILAGGQGTRLGSDLPKGILTLPRINMSLFQIHFENVAAINHLYGIEIKVIIMTSSCTDNETKKYLQKNNYFNLNPKKIFYIMQKNSVCFNLHDKPLPYFDEFAEAPNGNGAVFKLLKNIEQFQDIKYVNIISIDNALARICDPLMLGYLLKNDLDVVNKAIKRKPGENVGVFIRKGDNIIVREYSEMQEFYSKHVGEMGIKEQVDEESESRSSDTKITPGDHESYLMVRQASEFKFGNICNHLFKMEFIQKIAQIELPCHKAYKKIPFTSCGKVIKPKEVNGYKNELFLFDCFVYTKRNGVVEVPRVLEFAPVKNGMDKDVYNMETAANALFERGKILLEQFGAKVKANVLLKASASVFGEGLERYKERIFNKDDVVEGSKDGQTKMV